VARVAWTGQVVSIHIATEGEAPMRSVGAVRAVPGKGLEGDRYFTATGTYSDTPGSGREITLIESEAIEAMARDNDVRIEAGNARRNVVTRGVPLNHLVGQDFSIGDVRLRGLRLCEPCAHLEGLTRRGVLGGLVHRGGLRAQILTEGTVHVGDPIEPAGPSAQKPSLRFEGH
jgi:MOSC domain-containing protein YiiM